MDHERAGALTAGSFIFYTIVVKSGKKWYCVMCLVNVIQSDIDCESEAEQSAFI